MLQPAITPLTLHDNLNGTVRATRSCIKCEAIKSFEFDRNAVILWISGELIHRAFPNVTANDREFYFQSGICPTCWDDIFGTEE